jgi:molecular chaperone DnaK (HSP70)
LWFLRISDTVTQFVVGIDLGTSNSAMAFVEPGGTSVVDFPIVQLQQLGAVGPLPLLPSCIYIPGEHELPPETIALPWESAPRDVIGELARWQGARVPGRLVTSAKSWLSHSGVDRTALILPWGAAADVNKISPVEASARLLRHMAESWNAAHPDAPLANQDVVITVPASFDEVARALTVTAAKQAGLERFTLLEEPQAAFYDFTARHRTDLDRILQGIRLLLIADVGGGTTDFSLIRVDVSPDGPLLRRIAVGEHLMLGGDNMDAAVARGAEERLVSGGRRLSSTQWSQLVQASRLGKEALLSDRAEEQYHLSIVAEGSRLIGGSMSTVLSRAEVERIVLDGFFPYSRPDEITQRGPRVALQELGLPYTQEPAITRQLAAFLRAHREGAFAALGVKNGMSLPRPDAILLNGGVFNAPKLAARFIDVVSNWWAGSPRIRTLEHESLELAVARGAAYYGLVRRGQGRRIGGGAAHAFYIGLEKKSGEPATALCVVPRGQEEGEAVDLGGRVFQLMLGRPVQFPLFTSTSDRVTASGDIVEVDDDHQPLPPIHTLLKDAEGKTGQIPIHLRALLTEIGTLELWCVSNISGEQWRLEFQLRGTASSGAETVIESMPPRFSEARAQIDQIFGAKLKPGTPVVNVKQLSRVLEQVLGPRDQWRIPVLRELWGALFAAAGRRRRSADHERVFFQLLGYTLRPGFGYPLDEWRAERSVELFKPGVHFFKEKPVWTDFWIMWRRIAGGLNAERHLEIWEYLKPHLSRMISPQKVKNLPKPKGIQPEGLDEMVRLAAALEHLPATEKFECGQWIGERLRKGEASGGPWAWSLGRLGARMPLYGSVHQTVPPEEVSEWLNLLLEAVERDIEGALFAVVQIARMTGDRMRDIDDELRARALAALGAAHAPPAWERLLQEVVAMETADKARAFGDTLPVGLAA